MKNKEFYIQKEIPQEEIERLKQIEYQNFVSETLLNAIDLKDKKILDAGAGPNPRLADFVARKGGIYVPLDIRTDVLKEIQNKLESAEIPFYGVGGDVKTLPFADETFDAIHQRFVLMNIAPETRKQVLKEVLRVAKKSVFLLEYNWKTLKSAGESSYNRTVQKFSFSDIFKIFHRTIYGRKI